MPFKDTAHTQNLVVALRVRPLSSAELGEPEIIHVLDENLVVLRDPYEDQDDILRANRSREKQYVFDHAFGPNSSQVDVFSVTTKPLIHNVVSGYNATVFAYGATGAGKTYTMLGNDRKLGIMGLTLNDLFAEMELTKEEVKYKVTMSYLEIYNEMIRDLLNPSTGILELREDARGVNVTGLSEVEAKTTSEVMGMLLMGNKQRTSEPTAANKTSSRSHAILQVTVKQKSRVENVIQEVKVGKLFMIDLAGSERAAQTKNRGKRMIEGAHINRSLLALGNCINALSENRGHYVNFRDSKLTRLLKDSLGGNCKTVMIAHVSPAGKGFEESRNTLLYADRAKNIKTTIKKNQFNVSYHIAQYTNIITDLRKEIFRLKNKIAEQSVTEIDSNKTSFEDPSDHPKHKDHTEMNKIRNQLVSTFREQMEIRHKLMELEDMAMQIALDTNRYMLVIDEWEQEKVRRASKNAEMEKERNEKESEPDRHIYHDHDSTKLVDKNGKRAWRDKDEEDDDSSVDLRDRSNSYEDVENKDLDREKDKKIEVLVQESEPFSMAEPEDVTFAREEINNLIAEEKKVSEMKTALQSKLQQTRKEVERLEEQLPKKISSEENREILSLICKVHELEITNAELQSQALLRENILRYKDLEVSKYESRQKLCDEIIQMQRAVITDAQVNCPSELEGLYEVYLQQSSDTDERDSLNSARPVSTSSNPGPPVSVNRAAVLAGINRRMTSRENLFTFTSKLSPLTEETPSRLVSLQNSPIKTSRPTPSTYNTLMENSLAESSPTSPAHTPKYRSRVSSPDDISIRSSFFLTTPKKPNNDTENYAPLTPVFSRTQKFTDLSTRRRIMMDNGLASSGSLREDVSSSKMSSLVSVREKERDGPMASVSDTSLGINSNKQAVKPSLSLGDLSMIDKKASDQVSVDSVPVTRKRITKKGKTVQGKMSTPTRLNKRQRSASLDDARVHRVKPRRTRKGQQEASKLHRPKQHQFPNKIRERVNLGLESSSPAGNTKNKRSHIPKALVQFNDAPRGVARSKEQIKYSRVQTNDYQDGELQSFVTNVTPTSTVRQIGTPPGKGLTIQKRYRAPSDMTGSDSNQSTPRLKPRKQQSVGNSPVDALSVSGVAMRPTKQYAGIRRF